MKGFDYLGRTLVLLAALGLTGGVMVGCSEDEQNQGTVEEAAEDAQEGAEDAADEAGDAAEEAADEAGDAAEEAGDAAEDAADDATNY